MIGELLRLCNYPIGDRKTLSMRQDFPKLLGMKESNILIPLQSSLTVNLPPVSSMSHRDKRHNLFDPLSPTFSGKLYLPLKGSPDWLYVVFNDEIEIMHSLAKPRKLTVNGSDGIKYMFLAKPKDDLRKDARLMQTPQNKFRFSEKATSYVWTNWSDIGLTAFKTFGRTAWWPWTRNVVLSNGCQTLYLCDPYCWNTTKQEIFQLGYVFPGFQGHAYWQMQSKELNDVTRRIEDGSDKDAAELFVTKILPE